VAPPLLEQLSDLWDPDTPGAPSGGSQLTAQAYPALNTTAEERPYYAKLPVGLPDIGTRDDGMRFKPVATGLSGGGSQLDPYLVDVDPSFSTSNAFAPVLNATSSLPVGGESSAPGEWDGGEAAGPSLRKIDVSSGQADASRDYQGGGQAFDLSRTNELLQQLLDEVRRGGQGFLPVQSRDQNALWLREYEDMASFGGASIFGTAVSMTTADNPREKQLNAYFGLSGLESLDGGLRGRVTHAAGLL